jgi:hypothetical protein
MADHKRQPDRSDQSVADRLSDWYRLEEIVCWLARCYMD